MSRAARKRISGVFGAVAGSIAGGAIYAITYPIATSMRNGVDAVGGEFLLAITAGTLIYAYVRKRVYAYISEVLSQRKWRVVFGGVWIPTTAINGAPPMR